MVPVSGGVDNHADNEGSSVTGGQENTARGKWSSVTGGKENEAGFGIEPAESGQDASVSGGEKNDAAGGSAWIGGGAHDFADAFLGAIVGGEGNEAHVVASIFGGTTTSPMGATQPYLEASATLPTGPLGRSAAARKTTRRVKTRGSAVDSRT